jgi:uncharacterized glyoxalase superfamily protein PhnB
LITNHQYHAPAFTLSFGVFFAQFHSSNFNAFNTGETNGAFYNSNFGTKFITTPFYICTKKMKQHPLLLTCLLAGPLTISAQSQAPARAFSMESIAPNIYVRDIKQTIDFYKMLGFELITTVPDHGDPIFALMRSGGVTLMFQTFASIESTLPVVKRQDGGSLLLYIKVKKIRVLYEELKDKVPVLHGLEKTFYGATEFSIKDINNYMLTFAENE